MGLFSKFKAFQGNRKESRIAKAALVIKNPKAIKEDRWGAIEFFKDSDDIASAVPALLMRFEFSLEHGINDTREKEACMEGVTRHGEAALPYVKDHLKQTTRIAWPIKILKALGKEETVIEALKSALNYGDVTFDQSQIDKNYDILCHLIEHKMPGYSKTLMHFLKDPDERVRYACAEVLIEQDDADIPALLEPFLSDPSPDNSRIRQAVMTAFVTKKWRIANPTAYPEGRIADGILVNKNGYIEARV